MYMCNQMTTFIELPTCPHRDEQEGLCLLASWLCNISTPTTPEICRACGRCDVARNINEVTLSLAHIPLESDGIGTRLHNLITWFVPQPKGCNCPNRVAVMNAWGVERCRLEKATILSWLRESALENNYPYSEYVISAVLTIILR